jgi:hypothetical protein
LSKGKKRARKAARSMGAKIGRRAEESVPKAGDKAPPARQGQPPKGQKYHPAPSTTPFPGASRSRGKTPVQGGGGTRKRWKDEDGNIYEWDSQHGTFEKYDRRGRHQGEYDTSGKQTKEADPNRKVEP